MSIKQDPSKYAKIGSAADVSNVNPLTSQFWDMLTGNQANMMATMQGYRPEESASFLSGFAPQAQQAAQNIIAPYQQDREQLANLMSQRAVQDVASQFSGMNALNSSAALQAMATGAAAPRAQLMSDIAQMQSQLGGGLASQGLGQFGGAYNTLANLFGIGQQLQGAMAAPEYFTPAYAEPKGWLSSVLGT